ncbi:hypothetical protein GAYE_SCF45G5712 [Galdieria yellowstonensis]|uniref:Uncharacterized protein n=1 Tax=Galdieria yellowstonensis TaxID=3028027 RepID=A0AAV9IKD2_9RHOD|nr:hypothetical protein GAYE_SCF45G5712 [Galdieria yellowstonensis]
MVSPQTSRKCLREIISVSPNTEFTARIHSDYGRVRYRKSNYVTKETLLEKSWLSAKSIYRNKLTWFGLVLLLTCFNAWLDSNSSVSESNTFSVTTRVDKEIPYERWWRDDTDYEQQQQQLSCQPASSSSSSSFKVSSETHKVENSVQESTKPSTSPITKPANKENVAKNPKSRGNEKSAVASKAPSNEKKNKREPTSKEQIASITCEDSYFSLNESKVSLMLGKFIKQYRIESLVQGRCKPTKDTLEMIRLVERYPNLRFLGMHPDAEVIENWKRKFGESLRLKFVVKDVMDEIPFGFHLMWNLEAIHDQPYETVLRFFVQLKRKKYKYVALIHVLNIQNERVLREKGTYLPINVRSKPFSLPMPLRMVKEVGKDHHGNSLQLLLYDISQLPDMENDDYLREFLSWIG